MTVQAMKIDRPASTKATNAMVSVKTLINLVGESDGRDKPRTPKVVNSVRVLPKVRELARLAIDRMLELAAPAKTMD